MAQKAVELILMRQLASYLAVPIFLVDPDGNLLYYNEPAERLLGRRYDETGEMPARRVVDGLRPDGRGREPARRRGAAARRSPSRSGMPAHRALVIRGLDGVARRIAVTAFPLEGQGRRRLGAVAIFWEERPS